MHARTIVVAVAIVAASAAFAVEPAKRECVTLGFSVNDYGKTGPTEDAKTLLDKHIADYAKRKGIADYTVGAKTVTCKLFLDFGFFDEYTCKAEAKVCWRGKENS